MKLRLTIMKFGSVRYPTHYKQIVSLLNVIYKIASGCIANRLKQVLPHLIHENQKGFLKGRFIGENIRLLYDILLYTELNDIPGMLLMIDFEKKFLINVLDFFSF